MENLIITEEPILGVSQEKLEAEAREERINRAYELADLCAGNEKELETFIAHMSGMLEKGDMGNEDAVRLIGVAYMNAEYAKSETQRRIDAYTEAFAKAKKGSRGGRSTSRRKAA